LSVYRTRQKCWRPLWIFLPIKNVRFDADFEKFVSSFLNIS
jgi:hypothetical protein